MALITHKQQTDFLGRTMRVLGNIGAVNVVFDGFHNGERGSYTAEKGYFRYVRFEKEPYVIFIEVRGRDNYDVCIHTFNGIQISHKPTSLKKLKELFEACKQPNNMFEKYISDNK